jgi:hypothetical protein
MGQIPELDNVSAPVRLHRDAPVAYSATITKLVEQRLGVLQDWRVQPFGEPAVDRREKITGFRALALVAPELTAFSP